jgi:hypothetical protein
MSKDKNEKKDLMVYDNKYLADSAGLGMKNVDPADVRPPQIRLIQKSSDQYLFKDKDGNQAKVGQFFHTGRLEILDSFEAYMIYAAKGKYIDKRKPEQGEKDQYNAIGAMADDLSLFGIQFRSSALFTLSPLFTATHAMKRPMYAIKVRYERKELTNKDGTWWIPVMRVIGQEEETDKLGELERQAVIFDMRSGAASIKEADPDEVPDEARSEST